MEKLHRFICIIEYPLPRLSGDNLCLTRLHVNIEPIPWLLYPFHEKSNVEKKKIIDRIIEYNECTGENKFVNESLNNIKQLDSFN